MSAIDAKQHELWISDCKRYVARRAPSNAICFYDVVEIATGKAWLSTRRELDGFDDPRCGIPEFSSTVISWSNRGHGTQRTNRRIPAFELTFVDFDMSKVVPFATPSLARHEAAFRRQVPLGHVRRHAHAEAVVARALAAGVTS